MSFLFGKEDQQEEFNRKVNINFNTFNLTLGEDKEGFIRELETLLDSLPNVEKIYDQPNTPFHDELVDRWLHALHEASTVVKKILMRAPRVRYCGPKAVYITDSKIDNCFSIRREDQ